jgi:hypothetical protein
MANSHLIVPNAEYYNVPGVGERFSIVIKTESGFDKMIRDINVDISANVRDILLILAKYLGLKRTSKLKKKELVNVIEDKLKSLQ